MNRWQGKVAVVTGSSTGIGAAIAKELVEAGMKVVGLSLFEEPLEKYVTDMGISKDGGYYPRQCDVSKEQEILDAFAWVKETFGGVDVLVNSAGVFRSTTLLDSGNTESLRSTLDVNVLGLCFCTREAFKSMKERDVAGHIIHINSVCGHIIVHGSLLNMYGASKHCVTALTETLRQEMIHLGSRTKVTSISPGLVDTAIVNKSQNELIKSAPKLQTKDIAGAVLYCLGTPEHVQVHELTIRPVGERL